MYDTLITLQLELYYMSDKVTIKIPRNLYNSLKEQIEATGFNSVTDFVVYLLRDIVASGRIDQDISLTKKEIELIKKRLKTLGYL
jgi:Arc/MetJ-type ribon-helix-helix transcriptional regulator